MDRPDYLRPTPYALQRKAERRAKRRKQIGLLTLLALSVLILIAVLTPSTVAYERTATTNPCELHVVVCEEEYEQVRAYITGYNTVPEQTWGDPCIAASGANICGRDDVAACPRSIELGTVVEIDGKEYTCLDRLAPKYDHRYDINCDKDMACPYAVTGYKLVTIKN